MILPALAVGSSAPAIDDAKPHAEVLARGDFSEFYRQRGHEVFAEALWALETCHEAEEVTGEVFAAIWREWPSTRTIGGPELQALTLAACAHTFGRHHSPERGRESQMPWLRMDSKDRSWEVRLIVEKTALVASALSRLREEDRALLDSLFPSRGAFALNVTPLLAQRAPAWRALHRFHRQLGVALYPPTERVDTSAPMWSVAPRLDSAGA